MRVLAILVGAIALGVPAVASADGGQEREGKRKNAGVFASVAVEVCRDAQVRPFGVSEGGESAARQGNRRCVKRVLKRERLLARAVLVCTERLADEETLSRRALTECLVGVLARKLGGRDENSDESKPEAPGEKKDTAKKSGPPASDAAAVAACKGEARDEGFAEEHEGLSFVEYYGSDDDDDDDERAAFERCVKSKLADD